MGIHHFTRAKEFLVPDEHRKAGEPDPNEATFDSDPRRSIPMGFGYRAGSLRLELVDRNADRDKFNCWARTGQAPEEEGVVDRPEIMIGTLTTKTMDKVYRDQRPK